MNSNALPKFKRCMEWYTADPAFRGLMERDILDFQKRFHSNPQMQQYVDDAIKDRICREGDTPAVIRSAITQCAGRMGMCFTGEDFERFSLPVNSK